MESHGAAVPTFTFASQSGWHDLDEATQQVHARALALQSKQRTARLTRETTALLSILDASQAKRLMQRKIERQQRRETRRMSSEAQASAAQLSIEQAAAADRDSLIKLRREHESRAVEQHSIDLRERSDQMMPSQEQIIDLRQEQALADESPDDVAKRERSALIDLRKRHSKSTGGPVPIRRDTQPRSAAGSRRWG